MVGKTKEKQALRRARQPLPNKGRRAAVSGRYSPFTCWQKSPGVGCLDEDESSHHINETWGGKKARVFTQGA